MMDITKVPLDDQNVWNMISEGSVKGCFQIESHLGRTWCQKVKPTNISELSDLIAIIRPGVLQFVYDEKSMAQHYVDRKHGIEPAEPIHPALADILKDTYQVLIYQEQIIRIAQEIAGFSEAEGDILRKSVGKKDAKLLNSLEESFVNGCVNTGLIDGDSASLVFENIRKSSRYLFNKSHSISYAFISYWSAYEKYYMTKLYFKNWLSESHEKIDPDTEKKQLIMSARSENIKVYGPHYSALEDNFFWDRSVQGIRFGICNVKNVGKLHLDKMKKEIGGIQDPTWSSLCIKALPNINKRAVENLIKVGAFSGFKKTRSAMQHEFSCILGLTKKELDYLSNNCDPSLEIVDNIKNMLAKGLKRDGGPIATQARYKKIDDIVLRIENPGRSLLDNPANYAKIEERLLGCAINHSELSACSDASYANATCKEINNGRTDSSTIACVIRKIREHKTKNKDIMAFASVEDETGELDNIVFFPDIYEQNIDIIYEDATVLLSGKIDDSSSYNSFVVDSVFLI